MTKGREWWQSFRNHFSECATHSSSAGCHGGNLRARLGYRTTCDGEPMCRAVFYSSQMNGNKPEPGSWYPRKIIVCAPPTLYINPKTHIGLKNYVKHLQSSFRVSPFRIYSLSVCRIGFRFSWSLLWIEPVEPCPTISRGEQCKWREPLSTG